MVPSTLASIDWRLEVSVEDVPCLPPPVVVQPASARPPKASAAVVFNMKFRLCIVFLRHGSGAQPRWMLPGLPFELYHMRTWKDASPADRKSTRLNSSHTD